MRRLLRPILLEFFRVHLILTAVGALLTVLVLILSSLLGFGESLRAFFGQEGTVGPYALTTILPALPILGLCLLAYLPAGRFARKGTGLARPDTAAALQLLLLPAAAFWLLLAAGGLLSNSTGFQLAAMLLNWPRLRPSDPHQPDGRVAERCPALDGLCRGDRRGAPAPSALFNGELHPHPGAGPTGDGRRLY